MSKVKPYKEPDAPDQLANEPMMAYNHLPAKKENVSKRFVIDQLCGAVYLPADFDYEKELEDAVRTKYL